jgi:hypothetical protein
MVVFLTDTDNASTVLEQTDLVIHLESEEMGAMFVAAECREP